MSKEKTILDGFNDILSSILSDPKSVEALKEIASELSKSEGAASSEKPSPASHGVSQGAAAPDLTSLFSGLDPKFLETAFSLIAGYNSVDEGKVNLLNSLKPYLPEEKRSRIDGAVRMLRILKVGKALGIDPERLFGRRG